MRHECGLCAYLYREHCANSESKYFNKPKLDLETCGQWTMLQMKPCPFCGGDPIMDRFTRRNEDGTKKRIPCVKCTSCLTKRVWQAEAKGLTYAETVRLAVYAWNQRATEELCENYSNVHSAVEYHT